MLNAIRPSSRRWRIPTGIIFGLLFRLARCEQLGPNVGLEEEDLATMERRPPEGVALSTLPLCGDRDDGHGSKRLALSCTE